MKLQHITMIALLGAAVAAPTLAQQGLGMGPGGGGRFAFDQDNTRGWALMTPEERIAHRGTMLAAKTYEECKAVQSEHHNAMEARAKEKGLKLPGPRQNACDNMKARGLFK
jgi:hypothetical protein